LKFVELNSELSEIRVDNNTPPNLTLTTTLFHEFLSQATVQIPLGAGIVRRRAPRWRRWVMCSSRSVKHVGTQPSAPGQVN